MRRFLVFLPFLLACPNDFIADDFPFDGTFPGVDATTDAKPFGDASFDAADATKFNGGGPFDCSGCICDGTLDYCFYGGGGGGGGGANAPFDDAGDAGDASNVGDASDASDAEPACDLDAAQTMCLAIPIDCLPKPTCTCLAAHLPGCTCSIDPSGKGLVITCPPKP